jgi:hypothetical protein
LDAEILLALGYAAYGGKLGGLFEPYAQRAPFIYRDIEPPVRCRGIGPAPCTSHVHHSSENQVKTIRYLADCIGQFTGIRQSGRCLGFSDSISLERITVGKLQPLDFAPLVASKTRAVCLHEAGCTDCGTGYGLWAQAVAHLA